MDFNPRSREGSDWISSIIMRSYWQFQSTLPRRERLSAPDIEVIIFDISIHAPAKGATFQFGKSLLSGSFQSTLPRRERLNDREKWAFSYISIHAPAKGATENGIVLLLD